MVCGLFLLTSFFVKGSSSVTENQKLKASYVKANQQSIGNRIFQDWESTLPLDFLSVLSAGEEVDPTDESTEDKTAEGGFPLHIFFFNYNFL
jgi:hypothetical protein